MNQVFTAAELQAKGITRRDVQRLLGHADLSTTQRYLGRYRSDAARPAIDMGLASVLERAPLAEVLPLRRGG